MVMYTTTNGICKRFFFSFGKQLEMLALLLLLLSNPSQSRAEMKQAEYPLVDRELLEYTWLMSDSYLQLSSRENTRAVAGSAGDIAWAVSCADSRSFGVERAGQPVGGRRQAGWVCAKRCAGAYCRLLALCGMPPGHQVAATASRCSDPQG